MKIAAIASGGGHWIELLRIMPAFDGHEVIFISTHSSFAETVPGHQFYTVHDASRWNKLRLFLVAYEVLKLITIIKPDLVVSTGAAPGLMGIVAGKLFGSKTIWLDSIANVDQISLSGRLVSKIADRVYTQWPSIAKGKYVYAGNVLS